MCIQKRRVAHVSLLYRANGTVHCATVSSSRHYGIVRAV